MATRVRAPGEKKTGRSETREKARKTGGKATGSKGTMASEV